MFPDASIHRPPAAREAPCGIRIIIEWITPERFLLIPPPHDLLGLVGDEPRRVQMILIRVPSAIAAKEATTTSKPAQKIPFSITRCTDTPFPADGDAGKNAKENDVNFAMTIRASPNRRYNVLGVRSLRCRK